MQVSLRRAGSLIYSTEEVGLVEVQAWAAGLVPCLPELPPPPLGVMGITVAASRTPVSTVT